MRDSELQTRFFIIHGMEIALLIVWQTNIMTF